jgi:hypothetical protein
MQQLNSKSPFKIQSLYLYLENHLIAILHISLMPPKDSVSFIFYTSMVCHNLLHMKNSLENYYILILERYIGCLDAGHKKPRRTCGRVGSPHIVAEESLATKPQTRHSLHALNDRQ